MRAALLGLVALSACTSTYQPTTPEAPIISQAEIETMADGRCFAMDDGTTRTESVLTRELVSPEVRASDGTITQVAIYRDVERDVVLPDRPPERFEVVCPQIFDQTFVSSLQRALMARGAFSGAVNGLLDAPTQAAVFTFQSAQGRPSANLSKTTARMFGLVP